MANVELTQIEERLAGQLLFNARLTATTGKMELPILIADQGSAAANESAVLRAALAFADELGASIRIRLGETGYETRSA